mgnify:CR=1 FL=1
MNNPGDYTEANAWQYFWTPAQYDIEGMKNLLEGKAAFTKKLNDFFTIESKNPNKFLQYIRISINLNSSRRYRIGFKGLE